MVSGCGPSIGERRADGTSGDEASEPGYVVPAVERPVERYGRSEGQEGQWYLPALGGRLPVVALVHGGYWKPGYDRHLEDDVAAVLATSGFAVWNIEYAPSSAPWPKTFRDVAAAVDHLPCSTHSDRLDLDRVAVAGHSAGGHLALWVASRGSLPDGSVGAGPRVRPRVAVAQAPIADLVTGAHEDLGGGAVQALMDGEPDDLPDRYAVSSPQALLPVGGVRITLVHGDADDVVPLSQSTRYAEAARALGVDVRLEVLRGVGHFEHLDPATEAVSAMVTALQAL